MGRRRRKGTSGLAIGLIAGCIAVPTALASNTTTPAAPITEYPLATADQQPDSITAGPDGQLWFTQTSTNLLGRITVGGSLSSVSGMSAPGAGIATASGLVWVTQPNAGEIARVVPLLDVVTEFPVTAGGDPTGITAGPDGLTWFTESGDMAQIGRITPAGTIKYFSTGLTPDSDPSSITTGPDGNLWFTESANPARIGRITPSGTITEFSTGLTPDSDPSSITTGPDGNLWFTESANPGRIGRITPSGTITEFSTGLTPDSDPSSITTGPDGNLWFTESANPGRIGRITPSGTITELATPTADSDPAGITSGPDGRMWFTESGGTGQLGAVDVDAWSVGGAPANSGPLASSGTAQDIAQTTATLSGTANPEGNATTYHFDWGRSSSYGSEAPSPDGTVGDDSSEHQLSAALTGLEPGTVYHYRLVATDCGGCASGTSYGQDMTFTTTASAATGNGAPGNPVTPVVAKPTQTPTPSTPTPTPTPTIGKTATAVPSGRVFVRAPGSTVLRPLKAGAQIPVGSLIDASAGTVRLTTALSRPATGRTAARAAAQPAPTQSVSVWGGSFTFSQTKHSGMITLTLATQPTCTSPNTSPESAGTVELDMHSAHATPPVGLWAHDNHGQYRTRGYNSVATVRGTVWRTVNTCQGTVTFVKRGLVSVLDLTDHRTVLVRAGHSYLCPLSHDEHRATEARVERPVPRSSDGATAAG